MNQEFLCYKKSLNHFIDLSCKDATACIAKEHGILGFTRLNICMEKLGMDINENYFITLPDYTYTRNSLRWKSGFPYGCIIHISQTVPFIPVDFRPNCCGVAVARIPAQEFDILKIKNKYYEILKSYDDIQLSDFNRRNHFFGLYYASKRNEYYFLIHGSFSFVKKELYSEQNNELLSTVHTVDILDIPFNYLIGEKAVEYYEKYLYYEKKTRQYRDQIICQLFPDAEILFNRTHEGFFNRNTILLGAYANEQPFKCPIMLSPEENLQVVDIQKPVIASDSLQFYCAPHGGGYALTAVTAAEKTTGKESEFLLTYTNDSKMLTNNIIDMPFYYRTDSADLWCTNYNKGKIVEELKPIFNWKI